MKSIWKTKDKPAPSFTKKKTEVFDTLEEYKRVGLVSNNNRRLKEGTTNKEWQEEWEIRKRFLTPYEKPPKRFGGKYSDSLYNRDDFDTGYQTYCAFINDCLKELKKGNTVYCFFIYQIEELYKFFPDIKATYLEDSRSFAVFSKEGYEEWAM